MKFYNKPDTVVYDSPIIFYHFLQFFIYTEMHIQWITISEIAKHKMLAEEKYEKKLRVISDAEWLARKSQIREQMPESEKNKEAKVLWEMRKFVKEDSLITIKNTLADVALDRENLIDCYDVNQDMDFQDVKKRKRGRKSKSCSKSNQTVANRGRTPDKIKNNNNNDSSVSPSENDRARKMRRWKLEVNDDFMDFMAKKAAGLGLVPKLLAIEKANMLKKHAKRMERDLRNAKAQAAASLAQKEEVLKQSKTFVQTHAQEKSDMSRVAWYNLVEKQVITAMTTYTYRDGKHGVKETTLKEFYEGAWIDEVAKLQEATTAPLFISKFGQMYSLGRLIGVYH